VFNVTLLVVWGEEEIAQTLTKAERALLQYITRHHPPFTNPGSAVDDSTSYKVSDFVLLHAVD
jgi:hypothetical protein